MSKHATKTPRPQTAIRTQRRTTIKPTDYTGQRITATQPPTESPPKPKTAHELKVQQIHETTTLLDALWRRNRNQHRVQHWWKDLGLLRRNLKRLHGLLEDVVDARAGIGTRSGRAKTEGKGTTNTRRNATDPSASASGSDLKTSSHLLSEAQLTRLRLAHVATLETQIQNLEAHMREMLLPRCWVSFSQILAERTWAGLGLVLLGVVGDVGGFVGLPTQERQGVNDGEGVKDRLAVGAFGLSETRGGIMYQGRTLEGIEPDGTNGQLFKMHLVEEVDVDADMGEIVPRHGPDVEPESVIEPDTAQDAEHRHNKGENSPFAGFDNADARESKRRLMGEEEESYRHQDEKANDDTTETQHHTALSIATRPARGTEPHAMSRTEEPLGEPTSADTGSTKRSRSSKPSHDDTKQKKTRKGRKGGNAIDELFAGLV